MMFAHFSLQKALYEVLINDIPLIAIVMGIYDKVPDNAAFPYIAIGEMRCADWASKTTSGMECMATLTIFSREGGRQQAAQIMERLYALLHDSNIAVDDHQLVMMRFASSGIELESDGVTYRGRMGFRTLLQAV